MKKILFVDDDPMCVEFMKLFFETENFESYSAGSLTEAKTVFDSCAPDVVVTDIELFDGSGIDFAKYAKLMSTKDIRIIGVTGHSKDYLAESGNDITSFDLLLTKPVDLEALKVAIG